MITGKKEDLDNITKNYVCKDDGGYISVAWHGIPPGFTSVDSLLERSPTAQEIKDGGCYILRCQHNHYPQEVIRQASLTQLYKQGEELPEPVQSNVKKAIDKRATRLPGVPQAETFSGIPATDLETGELLALPQIQALCIYARKYGLDPARGHVALMHGQPYITVDGYLYHANQENVPYSLTGRPLKVDELEAQGYGIGDIGWYSKVERHDTHQVFEGYGFVKDSERTEMSKKNTDRLRHPVVADKPGNMAIKRGDWQALRRAFPIGESPEEVRHDNGRAEPPQYCEDGGGNRRQVRDR